MENIQNFQNFPKNMFGEITFLHCLYFPEPVLDNTHTIMEYSEALSSFKSIKKKKSNDSMCLGPNTVSAMFIVVNA